MIADGKMVAGKLLDSVKIDLSLLDATPHITIITCEPDRASRVYLRLKQRQGTRVGFAVEIEEYDATATTQMLASASAAAAKKGGVVVQLPLPAHIDVDTVLSAIPHEADIDAFSYDGTDEAILPPVTGAIVELAKAYKITFEHKTIVVVGAGKLVGAPFIVWADSQGLSVTVVDEHTPDVTAIIKTADIIVSGVGQAGLIRKDMIPEGVVIFDAGTTEDGGTLAGDATKDCAEKSHLITPVPGGIGPVTLAVLLRNAYLLHQRR